jgi:hypothetical protein
MRQRERDRGERQKTKDREGDTEEERGGQREGINRRVDTKEERRGKQTERNINMKKNLTMGRDTYAYRDRDMYCT